MRGWGKWRLQSEEKCGRMKGNTVPPKLGRETTNCCLNGFAFKFPVIANQSADWCGNPPVSGEMYRQAPGKTGIVSVFGGNRYLVPFNRGIATTSVRTGLAMTALFSNNNLSFPVPIWAGQCFPSSYRIFLPIASTISPTPA